MRKVVILCLPLVGLFSVAALAQDRPAGAPDTQLADEFRGKIHYFGNGNGSVATIGLAQGKKSDCPRPDGGCPRPVGGSLDVELEFDGAVVKGTYRGTGGLRNGALIGRRVGAVCRLFDTGDGSVWAGRCDAEGFAGRVKSVSNASTQIDIAFEALGTDVVDYVDRDRTEWARKRFDYLMPVVQGNGTIRDRMAAIAELEGYASRRYRYAPDSLGAVDVSRRSDGGRTYVAQAAFQTRGGQAGWARARFEHDALVCVETSFAPGDCHALTPPEASGNPEN